MCAVHVGIRHDDDLMVAKLVQIDGFVSKSNTDGRNQGLNLFVFQDLIISYTEHIQDLSFKWQNRLKVPVSTLLRGSAGGVSLHNEQFANGRILFGAVRQFAWQSATFQNSLSLGDHLPGFSRGFSGPAGENTFLQNRFYFSGIFFKEQCKMFGNQLLH